MASSRYRRISKLITPFIDDTPFGRLLLGILGVGIFILFWEFCLEFSARFISGNNNLEFPRFTEAFSALITAFTNREFWNEYYMGEHILFSLKRVMAGFFLAVAIAVPFGLLMGRLWTLEYFLFPLNELARPIPPLAWIPIAIILLSGEMKVIFICFLGAYFPILISTIHGVKAIDPLLFDAAKTLGANRVSIFFKVVIPASSGYIMTGIRVGLGIAWMTIVAAEMIGSTNGVGWYVFVTAQQYSRFDLALGGIMLIAFVGYTIFLAMDILERRFLKWIGML